MFLELAGDEALSIYDALKKRYRPPEFGILFEVANRTGWGRYRYADAMAMSLYPSRGLVLHGIEIKAARGDWLQELRNPEKSAPIQAYCNYWWVVAPKGIIELDEMPATWGLLELHGKKTLRCTKQAPELEPKELDRQFIAAIFRRLAEAQTHWVSRASIQDELDQATQDGRDSQIEKNKREIRRTADLLEQLTEAVKSFESAAGVKIDRWHAGDVGRRVRMALELEQLNRSVAEVLAYRESHEQNSRNVCCRYEH